MKNFEKQVLSLILCVTLAFSFLMPCTCAQEVETEIGNKENYEDDAGKKDSISNAGTDIDVDPDSDVNENKDTGNSNTGDKETQISNTEIKSAQKTNSSETDAGYGNLTDNADQSKLNVGNTGEATGYGLYIEGEEITSQNSSTEAWEYNASTSTLTLKGTTIEGSLFWSEGGVAAGIYLKEGNLIVNLTADTTINCENLSVDYAHYGICNIGFGTLTITGPGTLTVNSGNVTAEGTSSYGIYSCGSVTIDTGAHVISNAGSGVSASKGLYTTGNLTVNGQLYATAGNITEATVPGNGNTAKENLSVGVQAANITVAGTLDGESNNSTSTADSVGVSTYANNSASGNISSSGTLVGKGKNAGVRAANIDITGGTASAKGDVGIEGSTKVSGSAEVTSEGIAKAFSTAPTADGFSVILNDEEVTLEDCTSIGTVKIYKSETNNTGGQNTEGGSSDPKQNDSPDTTPKTSITPEKSEEELVCGENVSRNVTVYPEDTLFYCSSSNSDVVMVIPEEQYISGGQIAIFACSAGEAEITLTAEDGTSAAISVTVSSAIKDVEYISVRNKPESLTEGQRKNDLTVDIFPLDAANLTYSVTSSDSTVISCPDGSQIDPQFSITALKEGTSTITVSSANGKTDEWTVTVLPESEYDITAMSGDGVWETGDFSVTCSGPAGKLNSVAVDRAEVQTDNYTYTENDTSVITFKEEFMAGLDAGTHYLELFYNNGRSKAIAVFSIPEKKAPPTDIIVDCPDTVEIGKSITALVKVLPDNAYNKDYEITVTKGEDFISYEKGDTSFSINGIKKGTAVFLITSPRSDVRPYAFYVDVVEETVPVDSINTVPESVIVEVGKESTVQVDIAPENATDKKFLCSTSNTDIIEIGEITGTTFKVTGKKEGLAAIEVVSESDPQKRDIVAVNVVSASVLPESIIATPESNTLSAGKSIDVSVVMTPDTVTNKAYKVSVELDNPDVVYVESGELTGPSFKVIGLGEGTATLTVSSVSDPTVKSQPFSISCDVKVEKINTSKSSVFLGVEESDSVSVSISPSNASNKKIRAYSRDTDIAMLDSSATDGLRIVGVAPGETDIVLEAKDGSGVEKDIHVTVSGVTTSIQLTDASGNPVTTTSINQKYGTKLLVAQLYPDTLSADVLWSSSNPLVAYVLPANGESTNTAVVTGYGSGTAVITAEAGDAKASCTVNVSCGDNYYEITYKDNSGVWYYDYPSNFTVKCSSPEYAFYGIQIDGVYVDSSRYTVSPVQSAAYGISLTISSNYMKTLSTGRHLLTLYFNNGANPVSTYIYVQSSKDSPKTGDAGIMPEIVLMAVSAGFLSAVNTYRRKKNCK